MIREISSNLPTKNPGSKMCHLRRKKINGSFFKFSNTDNKLKKLYSSFCLHISTTTIFEEVLVAENMDESVLLYV